MNYYQHLGEIGYVAPTSTSKKGKNDLLIVVIIITLVLGIIAMLTFREKAKENTKKKNLLPQNHQEDLLPPILLAP